MKYFLFLLLFCASVRGQPSVSTTPYTRNLLVATNAAHAREKLGVNGTNQSFNGAIFSGAITNDHLTASRAMVLDSAKRQTNSVVTSDELGYLSAHKIFNVKSPQFGATGDGVADDTGEFQAAIDAADIAGGEVFLPPGAYKITADLVITNTINTVSIRGSGMGSTILNFESATLATAGIVASGSLTALPSLSANIVRGDHTVTFASAHGLSVGDKFIIQDTDNGSWNPARTAYKAGEWLVVASVTTSSEVETATAPVDTYATGGDKSLWKVTTTKCSFSNFTMENLQGFDYPGIKVSLGSDLAFSNLDLSGSRYTQVFLDRVFNVSVSNVKATDYQASAGLNYGFQVNGQEINFTGCFLKTTRHGLAFGSNDSTASTINRFLTIQGGTIASFNTDQGLDFHGNCEYYSVINVMLPTGVVFSGDHGKISKCTVFNDNAQTYAISSKGEELGWDFEITGNTVYATRSFDEGLISVFARTVTQRDGGRLSIVGNTLKLGSFGHSNYPTFDTYGIQFGVASANIPSLDLGADVSGNKIYSDVTDDGGMYHIRHFSPAGYGLRRLSITGNILERGGIELRQDVQETTVSNNQIYDANEAGIIMTSINVAPSQTNQVWNFIGNKIYRATTTGLSILGDTNWTWIVADNIIMNCAQTPSGTAAVDASFRFNAGGTIYLDGNYFGDTAASPNQARTFTVSGTTNVFLGRNINLGKNINGITHVLSDNTREMGWNRYLEMREDFATAAPTSGSLTNRAGDIVWNTAPGLTGGTSMPGWLATVAGAPGTWKEMAPISTTDYIEWNYTHKTIGIGGASSASYNIPVLIRRDTNALLQVHIRNSPGLGNTSAAAAIRAQSQDSSGYFIATPSDGSNAWLRDKIGIDAGSDSTAAVVAAVSSGQTVDLVAGSGTVNAQLDSDSFNLGSGTVLQWSTTTAAPGTAGATVSTGAGVPASTPADGSLFLRTDGAAGTTLYERAGGAWSAVGGSAGVAGTMVESGSWATGQVPFASDSTGTNFVSGPLASSASTNATLTGGIYADHGVFTNGITLGSGGTNLTVTGNVLANGATFTNAISVASGGTGAATLTGALVGNGTGAITGSSVDATELGYVNGVTSAIQTQFGEKITAPGSLAAGDIIYYNGSAWVKLALGSASQVLTVGTNQPYYASNSSGKSSIRGGSSSTTVINSTTYYSGHTSAAALTTTQGRYGVPIDFSGTITSYWIAIHGSGGTGENVTVDLWLNNATSIGSHTEVWNSWPNRTITSGLSQAFSSGDYIEVRIVTPAWATPPTGVTLSWGVTCTL